MEDGPIALLQNGDMIEIDINACRLNILVADDELNRRREKLVKPEPKIKTGYLRRYSRLVSSGMTGAVLKND